MQSNPLAAGASTQSRARRPLPKGWNAHVLERTGVGEQWFVQHGKRQFFHDISVSWCLDQGGPVLGYTSEANRHTATLRKIVSQGTPIGMYGPGSIKSWIEVRAAEYLLAAVGPFLGSDFLSMRWFANGSDACSAAVRLARFATDREAFISIGYHGSGEIFISPPQNGGVPQSTHRINIAFGDTQRLLEAFEHHHIACMIVEVPSLDDDAQSFLTACRLACDRKGALLILDEVVTGFRLTLGGAAELYHVKPDMACYGKALSNGRGIAALVGSTQVMDALGDRVFYSNTYNGDPYNCLHVIGTLQTLFTYGEEIYPYIWELGRKFKQLLSSVGLRVFGHDPRSFLSMDESDRVDLCQFAVTRGVVLDRPNYMTWAHRLKHVVHTVNTVEEWMEARA